MSLRLAGLGIPAFGAAFEAGALPRLAGIREGTLEVPGTKAGKAVFLLGPKIIALGLRFTDPKDNVLEAALLGAATTPLALLAALAANISAEALLVNAAFSPFADNFSSLSFSPALVSIIAVLFAILICCFGILALAASPALSAISGFTVAENSSRFSCAAAVLSEVLF
jgi:hypothetical protein